MSETNFKMYANANTVEKNREVFKHLPTEALAKRKTSGLLKRCPFFQLFLYVNPHSPWVPFLSYISVYGATLLRTNPL